MNPPSSLFDKPQLLFGFDVLFTTIFIIAIWVEHYQSTLLFPLLILIIGSYYPLWVYCRACNKHQPTYWHHDHEFAPIFYLISRVFIWLSFIVVVVVLKARVDILYILIHLSIFDKVVIFLLFFILLMLTYTAWQLFIVHFEHSRTDLTPHHISTLVPDPEATETVQSVYNPKHIKVEPHISSLLLPSSKYASNNK